jgi:hypothetical protein
VFADYDAKDISEKLHQQIAHGRYVPDHRFGQGNAGIRIAQELAEITFKHGS